MQIAVRIDVNDPGLAIVGEAEVHPAVVPAVQRLEGRERRADHPRLELGRQGAGDRGAVDALGRRGLPLRPVAHDVRPTVEGGTEADLRQRERGARRVPEQRDVDLASGDEALHQRRLLEGAEHAPDRVPEAPLVLHH